MISGTYVVQGGESTFAWTSGRLDCPEELRAWVADLIAEGDPIPAPEPNGSVAPGLSEPFAAYRTIGYALFLHVSDWTIEWPRYDDESRNSIY
jgi:hypothetical protein